MEKKKIFISYSHIDKKWKELLVKHLDICFAADFKFWEDTQIKVGDKWESKILEEINNADAAILLISADFLTSDFIKAKEIPLALSRGKDGKMRLFPLIIRECTWKKIEWLSSLQVYPDNGKPLLKHQRRHIIESILSKFAEEISSILVPSYDSKIPQKDSESDIAKVILKEDSTIRKTDSEAKSNTPQSKDKQVSPNKHQEMIKNIAQSNYKEVTCFIIDKEKNQIISSLHLDQRPSSKRKISFNDLVKDKAFKTRFFDLFSGEDSIPDRIKRLYEGKNWKFHSLLIFYSSRHKRVFIQDLPESAFFLNANETTFIGLNTGYSLISYNYETTPDQRITITRNNISQRFDILVDGKMLDMLELERDITATFPGCIESVSHFLQIITHPRLNEARFYFDKMAVVVRIIGDKYLIESYEAKKQGLSLRR